jgi:hypothetical protein
MLHYIFVGQEDSPSGNVADPDPLGSETFMIIIANLETTSQKNSVKMLTVLR